ncbi:hypothetical protein ACNP8T_002664, partial [Escherichia coli]
MLASLGGLVSCAAKVHFKEAGNAMNELIANHDFDFRQLVNGYNTFPSCALCCGCAATDWSFYRELGLRGDSR